MSTSKPTPKSARSRSLLRRTVAVVALAAAFGVVGVTANSADAASDSTSASRVTPADFYWN